MSTFSKKVHGCAFIKTAFGMSREMKIFVCNRNISMCALKQILLSPPKIKFSCTSQSSEILLVPS